MNKMQRWVMAGAVAMVAGAVALPVGEAQGQVITTRISLADFKRAYSLASVRRLIDPVSDGVRFYMVKRDKFGNKINWSDPNRAKVDASRSFIAFRANTSQLSAVFASLMQASVNFNLGGGRPSIVSTITCGLNGTSSAGVNAVRCGGGPTVSPR